MHRLVARSRTALKLRRLRSRFGIAAPRVTVRTQIPWYWRALLGIVVLGLGLALAGWTYDAGRRFAGFDRSESENEISTLRERTQRQESEIAHLREIANSSESRMQMDRATLERLTLQVKTLEEQNIQLKEDLAVFDSLASGGEKSVGVSLPRLRVEPEATIGHYHYRVLASTYGADAKQEFRGSLQFQITVQDGAGRAAMIMLPKPDDPDAAKFTVSFRAFRSIEGTLNLPADVIPKRVEARLLRGGSVVASRSVAL